MLSTVQNTCPSMRIPRTRVGETAFAESKRQTLATKIALKAICIDSLRTQIQVVLILARLL